MALAEVLQLQPLGPEPWGTRLFRARDEAGLGLREVAQLLGPAWLNRSTLSAFEQRTSAPTRPLDRCRVLLALVLYGVDPQEFGLSDDDIPAGVDLRAVRELGRNLGIAITGWYSLAS